MPMTWLMPHQQIRPDMANRTAMTDFLRLPSSFYEKMMDVVSGAAPVSAVQRILLLVDLRQSGFGKGGGRTEQGRNPHPEDGAGAADGDGGDHPTRLPMPTRVAVEIISACRPEMEFFCVGFFFSMAIFSISGKRRKSRKRVRTVK